jgi:hypothetical protein
MTVSAGNLDGLVNLSGPASDLYGINFSSGQTTGTNSTATLSTATVEVDGSTPTVSGSASGGTFRITSVNDTLDTATIAFNVNGVADGTATVYVLAFTQNAILLAPDAETNAIDINQGASFALSKIDSILSTTTLTPGTTLQLTATGTYDPPPVASAPTSTQATVIGAQGYVLTLDFATAAVASEAQAQLTPISTAISSGTIEPVAASGGTVPSLNANETGLVEIDTTQSVLLVGGDNTAINVATGPVTVTAGAAGNHLIVSSGQGAFTYAGDSGSDTVYAGGGNALVFGGATSLSFIGANGAATIIGGSVANTIAGGAGNELVFGNSSLTYDGGSGAATIIGAVNGNTVTGGTGNLLLFASGGMTYNGGSGAATVIGGGGPLIANLGAGGGIVYGSPGGGDILSTSSSTASILVGGGAGDVVSVAGAGNDTLVAGGGAETLNGAASSGSLVLFGGPGADDLIGGSGNDLFIAEPGNETLTGGGGNNAYVFLATPGTTRTDVITDFDPTRNAIEFFGYNYTSEAAADAAALASATTSRSVTTVSLSDGTHIEFLGAPKLTAANFF